MSFFKIRLRIGQKKIKVMFSPGLEPGTFSEVVNIIC